MDSWNVTLLSITSPQSSTDPLGLIREPDILNFISLYRLTKKWFLPEFAMTLFDLFDQANSFLILDFKISIASVKFSLRTCLPLFTSWG